MSSSLVYYRGSGLIANIALLLNLIVTISILSAFHATLTLPGIAGLALTMGMSVDANVLIMERIRDELRPAAPSAPPSRPAMTAPSAPSSTPTSP